MLGILLGAMLSATGLSNPSAVDDPRVTRLGDTVAFHVALFDREGRMLLSTRVVDLPEMEATKRALPGLYALPPWSEDAPVRQRIDGGSLSLGKGVVVPIDRTFLGKPVGFAAAVPVAGVVPGYGDLVSLERTRGPFNRSMSLDTELLDGLAGPNATGTFSLDDALDVEVLERGERTSRVRVHVEDGQVISIQKAGLRATVLVHEEQDAFGLELAASVGHEFALYADCAFASYVLPPGSYRVLAVDERVITLDRSPTKWPQLAGQDGVVAVLEISGILGAPEGRGREVASEASEGDDR